MVGDRQSRKLAVILHADVVGSTTLVQRDEHMAHQRIREAFTRLSGVIDRYQGAAREIRGDALVAEFARASDAVTAAVAFQIETPHAEDRGGDPLQPQIRIGISLGEVIVADNTITGAGVVLAQRLEQLAAPGGVVVQGSVAETVPTRLPFSFDYLGEQSLKGFDQPVRAFVARLNAGAQIPAPEAAQATAKIEANGVHAPERSPLSLPDKPSIAVLPFTNMSSDPEQEYFSDGISEDIITDLSKVSGLFVIARNSSFVYKNKAFNVPDVCRELGVKFALEGSIRRAGARVRITAQLIDGVSGGHLWAERYDRDCTDIFEVQDDVTQKIVAALKVTLSESERSLIADAGTKSVDAHDFFLRGRELIFGLEKNRAMFDNATTLFRRAIECDPNYAAAYAGLSMAYMLDHQNLWSDAPGSSLELAGRFASDAIAKDGKDPFVHYVAALVAMFNKDYERWAAEADKALSLNPNYALALNARGLVHIYTGAPARAIPYIEGAMRLDPALQQHYLHFLGTAYFVAGDYETAARQFRERLSLNPTSDLSRAFLASALGHLGELDEARRIWRELKEINPRYSHADHVGRLPFQRPADSQKFGDGLRRAGLVD